MYTVAFYLNINAKVLPLNWVLLYLVNRQWILVLQVFWCVMIKYANGAVINYAEYPKILKLTIM